jgi:hypothetical protein
VAAQQDAQAALPVWEAGPLVSVVAQRVSEVARQAWVVASVWPRAVGEESVGPEAESASLVDHQVS